jgi:hypothetical protein
MLRMNTSVSRSAPSVAARLVGVVEPGTTSVAVLVNTAYRASTTAGERHP